MNPPFFNLQFTGGALLCIVLIAWLVKYLEQYVYKILTKGANLKFCMEGKKINNAKLTFPL